MRNPNVFISCMMVFMVCSVASAVRAEENKQIPLESLVGKYEGKIVSHSMRPRPIDFQTEIVSVDTSANTVSLVNYCPDCELAKVWKRNNCKVTDAKEIIKFICKGATSDEEYTFSGDKLKATGVGSKFPFTISVTKIVK
jgi:hypothetical protein